MQTLKNEIRETYSALYEATHDTLAEWWSFIRDAWPLLTLVAVALLGTWFYVDPPPPRHIYMAAGIPGSSYDVLAKKYVTYFAKRGITLSLIATRGAQDNLDYLATRKEGVQAAFVQAGIDSIDPKVKIESLGSIAYEPIWFFYRRPALQASDFNGKPESVRRIDQARISLGVPGSASHAQSLKIMSVLEVAPGPHFKYLPYEAGVKALQKGEIDGLFLVESYDSQSVQDLLKDPAIEVADFQTADAFAHFLPYLKTIRIPHGGFSLKRDLPAADMQILATTTHILVDKNLHPAIQFLFLQAATAINGSSTFFTQRGEFPSYKSSDFTESVVANRFEKNGTPWLMDYFPFWLAELINRIAVLVLPICAVAYPFMLALPGFRLKRVRKRLSTLYADLHAFEEDLRVDYDPAKQDAYLRMINQLEYRALHLSVPGSLISEYYSLRASIDHVRAVLTRDGYGYRPEDVAESIELIGQE